MDQICTHCQGKGKMLFKITAMDPNDHSKVASVKTSEINCVYCRGTGHMTEQQIASEKYQREMWCTCGQYEESPSDWIYFKDGQHHILQKHHYRCPGCEKVKQVG
jgi:RecJ-like exonuclease